MGDTSSLDYSSYGHMCSYCFRKDVTADSDYDDDGFEKAPSHRNA